MEEDQDYRDICLGLAAMLAVVFVPTVLLRMRPVYTFLWNIYAVIAIVLQSPTALGLATVMGLSVMLSWYMLRFFDRSVFGSVLLGWFGFLSKYRVFCGLANTGDFLLHFVCPLALAAKYLQHVEVWMALPIVGYVKKCCCSGIAAAANTNDDCVAMQLFGAVGLPRGGRLAHRQPRLPVLAAAPRAVLGRGHGLHARGQPHPAAGLRPRATKRSGRPVDPRRPGGIRPRPAALPRAHELSFKP
jgi:hypothetical protein